MWTDWFGTAPWLIALLVAAIGVSEIVARRRLRRSGDLSPRKGEKRDPGTSRPDQLINEQENTVTIHETIPAMVQTYPLAPDGLPGPTGRSYWVVENRFAAGAYPGKKGRWELERVPEVVEQLLDAGIDRFVNLTQDYPGGTDRHLTHYDSDVEPHAEVGRYPIRDVYIPTEELMVEILDAIDNDLATGHNIYVHCWGGVGRTGTVVGCWLIRHGYATADDVLEMISDLRMGDAGRGPNAGRGETRESPETLDQVDFVIGWEQCR